MKTKILMAVTVAGLLGTSVYAANGMDMRGDYNQKRFDDNKTMMKHHPKMESSFFSMLRELNLTTEQKDKIFELRKEMMKDKQNVNVAFTKSSFDKEKFIKIMKQKRDNMLESKAEMIEKVYNILTKEQKEQLKVLIDLKQEKRMAMLDKRINFDKNCNGRR